MNPKLRILFAGTPDFAAEHMQALLFAGHRVVGVLTQPDRASGRGKKLMESAVKKVAKQYSIPLFQPASLRSESLWQQLATLEADIMVVVAYGLIVPKNLLELPPLGCINVHASLLPRWRGAAPIQRALMHGDDWTGITVMQMDVGLDSGDILYTVPYKIKTNETCKSLYKQLSSLGTTALLHTLKGLVCKKIVSHKQNEALVTYAEKISKKEAAINWYLPATTLERHIRAFDPWPVSYFTISGKVIKVWQAHAVTQNNKEMPKRIIVADRCGIQIATGEGILILHKLQLPGRKPVSIQDLLNANKFLFTPGKMVD